jgi:hypothetical protein
VLLPSSEVGQAISRKSWLQAQCLATFPRFNGLDGREKWRLREQTWKSSLRRNKFLPRKYRNRCRAILPCDPKFFHPPRVNALRTAKVRAPPREYVAALKFGLVLAPELDMDRSVGEHIRRLEEQLQRLAESNMENKALAERNQIESEIRATTLALSHYRAALATEESLGLMKA